MNKIKKMVKLLALVSIIPFLFSCAQPTGGETAKEPTKQEDNNTPSIEEDGSKPDSTKPDQPELVKSSPYVIYDNIHLLPTNDKKLQFRTPAWKITQSLKPELTLATNLDTPSIGTFSILKDFYITPTLDIYCLIIEKEGTDDYKAHNDIALKITKYTASDNYNNPTEVLVTKESDLDENAGKYPLLGWLDNIKCLAVSNNNLFLAIKNGIFMLDLNEQNYILTDETYEPFISEHFMKIKDIDITAIEVIQNKKLIVAGYSYDQPTNTYTTKIKEFTFNDSGKLEAKPAQNLLDFPLLATSFPSNYRGMITDFIYQDGVLYALVSEENNSDDTSNKLGGLITFDVSTETLSATSCFGINPNKNNNDWNPNSEALLSPKKFIAIKEKQLVFTEEGFYKKNASDGEDSDNNSVVTVDILENSLKFNNRISFDNIKMNQQYVNTCSYIDYDF